MSPGMDADTLIADSADRLFSEQVDKAARERAEAGTLDERLWALACDGGFHRLLVSEAAGGFGQRWSEAWPVLRGIGYWQVPLPLAETMVAGLLLTWAGIEVPDGPLTVVEQGRFDGLHTEGHGAALRLSGTAHRVPWARHAAAVVVSLADGGLALFPLRGAPGVAIEAAANHAKISSDSVTFSGAAPLACSAAPLPLAQPAWALGALARSAMMVGALEFLLEQSARYANERVQFGRPIGKNQALQQNLAVLAGDTAAARVASLVAAADAPSAAGGSAAEAPFSIAVAKVRCGEAATRGTGIAHQVHGAIGFTCEHALHFATRRLWAWREEFGSDAWWAERLGRAAIAGRSAGFWPSLTARRFADFPSS